MKHLVIIDGHHLMYRAYWAIPRGMRTSKGLQINAVFGFASMLLQIFRVEQPDSLLFCFDAGDQTFRHIEHKEYKAGRAETPDDFYEQIPLILGMIAQFNLQTVADPKYEADDFACTYARAAEREGMKVTIVSGDRDLFQLASDTIRIAIPHKGYQAAEYLDAAAVEKKYGVTPFQIPAYKGLVGDPSDNLPGVLGIGPKAASALLQKFGSMEAVYKNLSEIKPAWRSKLEAGREQALFCERMSQLICDIPLPVELDNLAVDGLQSDNVLAFFKELEFFLPARRFQALLASEYGQKHFKSATVSVVAAAETQPTIKKVGDNEQLSLL